MVKSTTTRLNEALGEVESLKAKLEVQSRAMSITDANHLNAMEKLETTLARRYQSLALVEARHAGMKEAMAMIIQGWPRD